MYKYLYKFFNFHCFQEKNNMEVVFTSRRKIGKYKKMSSHQAAHLRLEFEIVRIYFFHLNLKSDVFLYINI